MIANALRLCGVRLSAPSRPRRRGWAEWLQKEMAAEELIATEGATEFPLGLLRPYAVVDLRAAD